MGITASRSGLGSERNGSGQSSGNRGGSPASPAPPPHPVRLGAVTAQEATACANRALAIAANTGFVPLESCPVRQPGVTVDRWELRSPVSTGSAVAPINCSGGVERCQRSRVFSTASAGRTCPSITQRCSGRQHQSTLPTWIKAAIQLELEHRIGSKLRLILGSIATGSPFRCGRPPLLQFNASPSRSINSLARLFRHCHKLKSLAEGSTALRSPALVPAAG